MNATGEELRIMNKDIENVVKELKRLAAMNKSLANESNDNTIQMYHYIKEQALTEAISLIECYCLGKDK
jgi:hypothetical protein